MPFYKKNQTGTFLLLPPSRFARLFGHCTVGGHCSVILGGGIRRTSVKEKLVAARGVVGEDLTREHTVAYVLGLEKVLTLRKKNEENQLKMCFLKLRCSIYLNMFRAQVPRQKIKINQKTLSTRKIG